MFDTVPGSPSALSPDPVRLPGQSDHREITPHTHTHTPPQLFDGNIDAVLQTIKHRYEAGGAFKSSIPMRRRVRQYQQASPSDEGNGVKRVREDRKTGHASVTRYSHPGGATNITSGDVG